MPSNRRQFNFRLDDETAERLANLQIEMSRSLGLELSQSQIIRLALIELEKASKRKRKSP